MRILENIIMGQLFVIDTTAIISFFSDIFEDKPKISQRGLDIIREALYSQSTSIRVVLPSIVFVELHEKWCISEEISKRIYYEIFVRCNVAPNIEIASMEKEVLLNFVRIDDEIENLENHDKIIVATAMMHNAPIITNDPKIIKYARKAGVIPDVIS